MKRTIILIAAILLIGFVLGGCKAKTTALESNQETPGKAEKTLVVYTTIFPIEDFTKKIGGEHVQVKSVYPAGADAHTFEPTMKAMQEIAEADLLIYNGAGLEPFIDKTMKALVNEKVKMVEASKGIELLDGHDDHDHHHGTEESEEHEHDESDHEHEGTEHEHEHEEAEHGHEESKQHDHDSDHDHEDEGHEDHAEESDEHDGHHHDKDPHVWLDPIRAIMIADHIKEALSEAMPSAKEDFEKNYQEVKQQLEQLDEEFRTTIAESSRKEILVSHAAYGYWEHRYDLKQISVSGLSPENEPSQKQLQKIIEEAKEHQIAYISYDQTPVTKVAEVVKRETGTTPVTLHNLEYITENDLNNNEDYFSIMNKNIETLKKILN